jgi:hypothetical protein
VVFFRYKIVCQNVPKGDFRAARSCQEAVLVVPDCVRNPVLRVVRIRECACVGELNEQRSEVLEMKRRREVGNCFAYAQLKYREI